MELWKAEIETAIADQVTAGAATDSAVAGVIFQFDKDLFDEIVQDVNEAISVEYELLEAREGRSEQTDHFLRLSVLGGSFMALFLGAMIAFALDRDLTGPVARFAKAARAISRGDLSGRVGLHRRDELGESSRAFDDMADRLERTYSDLEEALHAARAGEARTTAITNSISEGIFTFDDQGFVRSLNPAAKNLFGITSDDGASHRVDRMFATGVFAYADERLVRLDTDRLGGDTAREVEGLHTDGSPLDLELVITPLRLSGAQTYIGVVRDISERKRAERTIAYEQRLFRAFMDHSTELIYTKDRDGRFPRVNRAYAAFSGLASADDLIGRTDFDFLPADEARQWRQDDLQVLTSGEPIQNRLERHRQPDGTIRWYLASKAPVFDEHGNAINLVGSSRDITELHQAQLAREESDARLRHALSSARMGTWQWDLTTNQLVMLEPEDLTDSAVTGPIERGLDDVFAEIHAVDRQSLDVAITHAIERRESYQVDYRRRHGDDWRWWTTWGRVLTNDDGQPICLAGVMMDITERRLAEDALRVSERRLPELFTTAEDQRRELELLDKVRTALASQLDFDTLMRTVVDTIAQTLGYELASTYLLDDDQLRLQHQVGYDTVLDVVPLDQGVMSQVARTATPVLISDVTSEPTFIAAMSDLRSEICLPFFDGTRLIGVLNVETRGERTLDERDLRLLTSLSDQLNLAIGRARLFQELGEREARFRSLLLHAADSITILNASGTITYQSPASQRILGRAPESIEDRTLTSLLFADDQDAINQALSRADEWGDSTIPLNLRIRHRDGSYRALEALATNLLDDPNVGGIVINARDVTERERSNAERERQFRAAVRAQSETNAVLDAASEAMTLITPDGRVASANRRFDSFFGVASSEIVGRSSQALRDASLQAFVDADRFIQIYRDTISDPERRVSEVLAQRWPIPRELELYSVPVLGTHDDYLGRLFAFRDVTHEREVDRMKTEFVSLVSHELRTPLTSIKGYVDLLLDGEVGDIDPDQREFLEIVGSNATRLVSLINDLLDISRIESGRFELNQTTLDLTNVIQTVASAMRPQVESKGQRLTIEIPSSLPTIEGDFDRLTQVFTNLVSNAHKYTPGNGDISIRASVSEGFINCRGV